MLDFSLYEIDLWYVFKARTALGEKANYPLGFSKKIKDHFCSKVPKKSTVMNVGKIIGTMQSEELQQGIVIRYKVFEKNSTQELG